MELKSKLKAIIISQGFTMSQVHSEINRRHGTNFTFQNFSNRFRKETFSYSEIEEILNIVGYHIEWIKD